jgi:hypothetical protein
MTYNLSVLSYRFGSGNTKLARLSAFTNCGHARGLSLN